MATTLQKGTTLFDPVLIPKLINQVRGKSTVAKLCAQEPVSFVGNKMHVFNFDSEINIMAEGDSASAGGISVDPVVMSPIKVDYGARVSKEYLYASEEERQNMLTEYMVGFGRKIASGLDLMVFHGINPRTGTASAVIGNNCIDKKCTTTVTYAAATVDNCIESAIEGVETVKDTPFTLTGIAMSPAARSAMSKLVGSKSGDRKYPDFAFGQAPAALGAGTLDINATVFRNTAGMKDHAIVGDFQTGLKWGYSKDIEMEVIEYGDPDGTGSDLKKKDEIYLRCVAYIGWGVFDSRAFVRVVDTAS